jgi:hypothetical protein
MLRSETVNAPGIVKLNGAIDSSRPDVHLSDFGLNVNVHGQSRSTLSLHAFNKSMATAGPSNLIQKPIEYVIEGTCLGQYTQNFGDMREPDFYSRVVKRLKICVTHERQCVTYSIEGFAALPEGEAVRPASVPTGDWTFAIWFKIPREDIERFYGLTTTARDFYFSYMDSL